MSTTQKSLRIPDHIIKDIEEIVKETNKDFTTVTKELLEEAIKAYHCPGIVFTHGTSGKRARVAGTGIEVWEIIATYQSAGRDYSRLKRSYSWFSEEQLRAAIGYYRTYKQEIDSLIAENEGWTKDEIRKKYPFLSQ